MKKLYQFLILTVLLASLSNTGCANFQNSTGKTLASIAVTVDGAMIGWADWVNAGQSTVEQEAKVKAAYVQYQLSMSIASNAYVAATRGGDKAPFYTAFQALVTQKDSLLTLIATFTTPKEVK